MVAAVAKRGQEGWKEGREKATRCGGFEICGMRNRDSVASDRKIFHFSGDSAVSGPKLATEHQQPV